MTELQCDNIVNAYYLYLFIGMLGLTIMVLIETHKGKRKR